MELNVNQVGDLLGKTSYNYILQMRQAHPFMKTFTELKLDEKFKEAISKKNQYNANTTFNKKNKWTLQPDRPHLF